MGFIFHLPGFDSCGEKGKVGSELMCLFVEKLLSFKKSMRPQAKRSLKEPSLDASRSSTMGSRSVSSLKNDMFL